MYSPKTMWKSKYQQENNWKTRMMIKHVLYIFVAVFVFSAVLSSCFPVMRVNMKKQKEYPPLEPNAQFAIYKKPQQIPNKYETLGKIEIICTNELTKKSDTTKCDSISVFRTAESKIKEIGGNALLITKHKKPNLWNSNYFFNADALKVFDFSSPPDLLYTKRKLKKSEIYGKGTWDLRLSLPYINHFVLKPDGERDISSAGWIGAAIGFDYYHQNTQYLSIVAGGVMDFILPFGPVDYFGGEEEFCSSTFIGLTNNHRYKFLVFGYGFSYSQNSWRHVYFDRDNHIPAREYTDNTLGLMFTGYWLPKSSVSLGIIYRPSFIRLNTSPAFKYEHLISIDLAWRIRLKTVAKHE